MSFQALKGLSKIPNPRSLRVRDPYVSCKLLKSYSDSCLSPKPLAATGLPSGLGKI
jgi:hypothetical protein